MTDTASAADRLAALEDALEELQGELMVATNRDIPLLKGTLRAIVEPDDVESIDDLPDAGRAFYRRVHRLDEAVRALEQRVAMLGDVGAEASSKDEKIAGVLAFAANKHNGTDKVAVSASEIKGCTGVSRRYAYDLMDAIAADIDGVTVRDPVRVHTGNGVKRKRKALLVDCDRVHACGRSVNQFTTPTGTEHSPLTVHPTGEDDQ